MFTGITEGIAQVVSVRADAGNRIFTFNSPFTQELKVDQSISHNGVCLTVTSVSEYYTVTAIAETLRKTNLSLLKTADEVNIERCLKAGSRLDGHIVQGHVDLTAICTDIMEDSGSRIYTFEYDASSGYITAEKGSICVNGVSLTVINSSSGKFSVAIIPYTLEHTTFRNLKKNDVVNIEFDIIGKYVTSYLKNLKL